MHVRPCMCVCVCVSVSSSGVFIDPYLCHSTGGGVPIPSIAGAVPAQSQLGSSAEDRYAALAELDNELSSSAPTGSSVQG